MKKVLTILTVTTIVALVLALTSCSAGENNDVTSDTTAYTTVTTAVGSDTNDPSLSVDLSSYNIVRRDSETKDTIEAVKNFKQEIKNKTGASLKVKTDEIRRGEELDESAPEILIGKTNRSASVAAAEKLDADETLDYIIETVDNKIVIVGRDESSLFCAMKEFLRIYVLPLKNTAVLDLDGGISEEGRVSDDLTVFNDFNGVETFFRSTVQSTTSDIVLPTYGRIVELSHNGANNGMLIATSQWSRESFPIYRSKDGGKTWSLYSTVTEKLDKKLTANWQPHLFELPCQVGDMPAGTLLLAGCTYDKDFDESGISRMCIWRSYNLGKTWEQFSTVDECIKGMWEPFLICDEDGSLVCFYSDESEVEEVNGQRLVFRVSKDGVSWGEKKYCVAPENKALRPGMVAVSKMGDNGYILSYELIGETRGPVYTKVSNSLTEWDAASLGSCVTTDKGAFAGATPFCVWTPDGGKNGTVIASGRYGSKTGNEDADLFFSFDLGKTWFSIDNPLPYDTDTGAYSLGFFTGVDGTVYYINNVYPSYQPHKHKYSDLMMAKLKVYSLSDEINSNVTE